MKYKRRCPHCGQLLLSTNKTKLKEYKFKGNEIEWMEEISRRVAKWPKWKRVLSGCDK